MAMSKSTMILLKTFGATPEALANVEAAMTRLEGPEVVAAVTSLVDMATRLPQMALDHKLQMDRIEAKLDLLLSKESKPPKLIDQSEHLGRIAYYDR